MHVGGVQLQFVENGRVFGPVIRIHVITVAAAIVVVVVVDNDVVVVVVQQFVGVEDHEVDHGGRVGQRRSVADKVHGTVVVMMVMVMVVHAAGDGRGVRRGRRGRQVRVVVDGLRGRVRVRRLHHVHLVLGVVLRLDGGRGVVVIRAVGAVHAARLVVLVAVVVVARRRLVVVVRAAARLVHVVAVVGGRGVGVVVRPAASVVVVVALVDGAAAQVQHGGRRALVVSGGAGDGHRGRRRRPLPDEREHWHVVGHRGRLAVDGGRGLRSAGERGREVVHHHRRVHARRLLHRVVAVHAGGRRPVLLVIMVVAGARVRGRWRLVVLKPGHGGGRGAGNVDGRFRAATVVVAHAQVRQASASGICRKQRRESRCQYNNYYYNISVGETMQGVPDYELANHLLLTKAHLLRALRALYRLFLFIVLF